MNEMVLTVLSSIGIGIAVGSIAIGVGYVGFYGLCWLLYKIGYSK